MESSCPAFSSFTVPGNSVPKVSYAHRDFHLMTSRSTLFRSTSLQVQSSHLLPVTSPRSFHVNCAALASTSETHIDEVEDAAPSKGNGGYALAPNSFEVQSLLMEVCDETSVAELMLKVGDFKLHVKRDVGKLKSSALPVTVAPPVPSAPMVDSVPAISTSLVTSPASKLSSSAALVLASQASKSGSKVGLLEAAADEGLSFATSPKVGLFRRSRIVKGKSGRPLCEEGQIVKEGQVVCYVEQLGTQQPVEAETSGEVMKILCKDGEPVGYGDPLIAIRPAFPGIK